MMTMMRDLFDSTAVCLAIDLAALGVVYVLYRRRSAALQALKDAPSVQIDSQLASKVQEQVTIPYAAVRGVVQAMEPPLRSKHFPNFSGVIRESVVKECKVRWSHTCRLWLEETPEIHRVLNYITFKLTDGRILCPSSIKVVEPLCAEELPLLSTYDQFTPVQVGLGGQVVGWLRGEHTKGIHEMENMLLEGNEITAIGELALVDDKLVMRPPSRPGLPYILTFASKEEVVASYGQGFRALRFWGAVLGCTALCLTVWLCRKWARKRAKRRRKEALLRLRAEKRKQARNADADMAPQCIVCASNPVEITILECGHACLCADCADAIGDSCPICRGPIERKVFVYLP